MTLDPDQLRRAMRHWATGVTVVTAAHDGQQHGMTVSSFTSIALDPPLVAISLQTTTRTYDLVRRAGSFGVTILAADQQELSDRFAGLVPDQADRLAGLAVETLVSGVPLLAGGLVQLDCRVTQTLPAGTNTLFVGEVLAVRSRDEGSPLLYHDRAYRRLQE